MGSVKSVAKRNWSFKYASARVKTTILREANRINENREVKMMIILLIIICITDDISYDNFDTFPCRHV